MRCIRVESKMPPELSGIQRGLSWLSATFAKSINQNEVIVALIQSNVTWRENHLAINIRFKEAGGQFANFGGRAQS
jgi:hypothetical protein